VQRHRTAFKAAKRRAQRHLRSLANGWLLDRLRHEPQSFWSDYRRDAGAADPGGAGGMAASVAHWSVVLGPPACGDLPASGVAGPRELARDLQPQEGSAANAGS
jgi:hypothetical protein